MQSGEVAQRSWSELVDGDLARAVAAGGGLGAADAEAELCGRFARRVRLYGIRHLGSEDAAGDLVQDVLLLVLRKLRAGEVRQPERIASFVLGTARMLVHERFRGRRREAPGDAAPASELVVPPLEPDRPAEVLLRRCLEALAERERTVLLLTYYGEQSAAEIARSLALQRGNVRVIRHRGLERLRDCVDAGQEGLG